MNNILTMLYGKDKPTKEEIKKIRLFFKSEKIIYNKEGKLNGK